MSFISQYCPATELFLLNAAFMRKMERLQRKYQQYDSIFSKTSLFNAYYIHYLHSWKYDAFLPLKKSLRHPIHVSRLLPETQKEKKGQRVEQKVKE